MSQNSDLQTLSKEHQELDQAVAVLQRRPGADDLELQKLKKQKLRLKDRMSQLSARQQL